MLCCCPDFFFFWEFVKYFLLWDIDFRPSHISLAKILPYKGLVEILVWICVFLWSFIVGFLMSFAKFDLPSTLLLSGFLAQTTGTALYFFFFMVLLMINSCLGFWRFSGFFSFFQFLMMMISHSLQPNWSATWLNDDEKDYQAWGRLWGWQRQHCRLPIRGCFGKSKSDSMSKCSLI